MQGMAEVLSEKHPIVWARTKFEPWEEYFSILNVGVMESRAISHEILQDFPGWWTPKNWENSFWVPGILEISSYATG